VAPSTECFTPYHGNEIIVWPSGTDSASPTFNATFFDAGEYIIQVNVTATIKHLGGSTTTLNATGYIGGDQSDITGNGIAVAADASAVSAMSKGIHGKPTRMVMTSGFSVVKNTFAELRFVPDKDVVVHHMYIKLNRDPAQSFGFWATSDDIWIDHPGQIRCPDPAASPNSSDQGYDVQTTSDPIIIARLRAICYKCSDNPPDYGFRPVLNVCVTWACDAWDDAIRGKPYYDPCKYSSGVLPFPDPVPYPIPY
jgi:hypothetical protein